jgi:hypothetical protein
MSAHPPFWHGLQIAAAGLALCVLPACKPAAKPAAPAKPAAKAAPAAVPSSNLATVPVSGFEELMPPQGRDPFFPNSHRRDPEPAKVAGPDKVPVAAVFVLTGMVGSGTHRLAVINGHTILEAGEEGSVRVGSGRVKLRCMEIGEDYAVIRVEGEAQTKRLQLSKKGL